LRDFLRCIARPTPIKALPKRPPGEIVGLVDPTRGGLQV